MAGWLASVHYEAVCPSLIGLLNTLLLQPAFPRHASSRDHDRPGLVFFLFAASCPHLTAAKLTRRPSVGARPLTLQALQSKLFTLTTAVPSGPGSKPDKAEGRYRLL